MMGVRRATRRTLQIAAARFLVATIVLAANGCVPANQGVRDDRMIRFFRELVYGEDFAIGLKSDALYRWVQPMRVSVIGSKDPSDITEIERQLAHVADLTGLAAALVDAPGNDANLEIRFAPESDFLVNREYVACYVHRRGKAGFLTEATIYIGADQPGLLQECLSHELMHALGFPQHSAILPSSLSPLHDEVFFTRWDDLAIRTLYDPRLKTGMVEAEAMPLVESIIGDKMSGGSGA